MPLTDLGKRHLEELHSESTPLARNMLAQCRRVIAKAEATSGPLDHHERIDLLKSETALLSTEIRAIVAKIEDEEHRPVFDSAVNWDSRKGAA